MLSVDSRHKLLTSHVACQSASESGKSVRLVAAFILLTNNSAARSYIPQIVLNVVHKPSKGGMNWWLLGIWLLGARGSCSFFFLPPSSSRMFRRPYFVCLLPLVQLARQPIHSRRVSFPAAPSRQAADPIRSHRCFACDDT